jgi:hypothetical protein
MLMIGFHWLKLKLSEVLNFKQITGRGFVSFAFSHKKKTFTNFPEFEKLLNSQFEDDWVVVVVVVVVLKAEQSLQNLSWSNVKIETESEGAILKKREKQTSHLQCWDAC